jgi:hypothetical protein
MALKFQCKNCHEAILTRFLKIGEVAKCFKCGMENVVPENAVQTDETPELSLPDKTVTAPSENTINKDKIESSDEAQLPPFVPINKILWDDDGPFGKRLWNTWVAVMFNPSNFFRQIPLKSGLKKPYFYSLIFLVIGWLITISWQVVVIILNFISKADNTTPVEELVALLIILPISPIIIFIVAGFQHLCLKIVRGNRQGFEATFRVATYSTSASILEIIPFVGQYISAIWTLVVIYKGLQAAHNISPSKATYSIAVGLLLLLCGIGIPVLIIALK